MMIGRPAIAQRRLEPEAERAGAADYGDGLPCLGDVLVAAMAGRLRRAEKPGLDGRRRRAAAARGTASTHDLRVVLGDERDRAPADPLG